MIQRPCSSEGCDEVNFYSTSLSSWLETGWSQTQKGNGENVYLCFGHASRAAIKPVHDSGLLRAGVKERAGADS